MIWGRGDGGQHQQLGAINTLKARVGWHHPLTDDPRWQSQLAPIFAKAPTQRTRRKLRDTRGALTRLCKHHP